MTKHKFSEETRKLFYTGILFVCVTFFTFVLGGGMFILLAFFMLLVGHFIIDIIICDEPLELQTEIKDYGK